jgi:hypothetical protein
MPFGGLLTAIIGAGASLGGGLLQSRSDGKRNDLITEWASRMWEETQQGKNRAAPPYDKAEHFFSQIAGAGGLTPELQALLGQISEAQAGVPGLFQNQNVDPAVAQLMSQFSGLGEQAGNMGGPLSQVLQYFGRTQDTGGLLDRFLTPQLGQANLIDQAKALLDQGGWNASLGNMRDVGSEILGQRGYTTDLQDALRIASGVATTGGRTEATQAGLQTLQDIISRGGGNALTDQMAGRGLELAGINPLLSMSEVTSAARDEAGRATKQAAGAALDRARARGGDAAVGTGLGNQDLLSFSDQAAENEAQAVQQARLGQQGLQLQQVLGGLNAAGGAGSLANQRLQTGTSGIGALTGVEGSKVSDALQAIAGLTQTSTNRLGTGANIGLGAEGQAASNLGLGANMAQSYANSELGRLQQALGVLGLESNNMFNSADTLGNLLNLQGNLGGMGLNAYLQNQGLNQERGQNLTTALQNYMGLTGNTGSTGLQALLNAASGLSGIGQGYLNFGSNALGGIAGLIGSYSPSQIGNTIMQGGLGMIAGALGNWSNRGSSNPLGGMTTSPATQSSRGW